MSRAMYWKDTIKKVKDTLYHRLQLWNFSPGAGRRQVDPEAMAKISIKGNREVSYVEKNGLK